jgi:hypothetical protein
MMAVRETEEYKTEESRSRESLVRHRDRILLVANR